MRELTKRERAEWATRFAQPVAPIAMRQDWDELRSIVGQYMLTQAGLDFVRDAFVAHRFADAVGADLVWLWPEERPDFAVALRATTLRYEVAEADWQDRKRSDEYKKKYIPERLNGTQRVEPAPELFRMRDSDAFEMLSRIASKKSDGRYDNADGLVILLQPNCWGSVQPKVERVMHAATEVAKDHFSEVWVMWGGKLYGLWSAGERLDRRLTVQERFREEGDVPSDDDDE